MKHTFGELTASKYKSRVCDANGETVANTYSKYCDLFAAAPDMLKVLEAVEWVDINTHTDGTGYDSHYICPWCGNSSKEGHAETCKRQAALKKAQGGK